MKNREVYDLQSAIRSCGNLKGIRFAYAMSKNANKVKSIIDDFTEASKPDPRLSEFEKKRVALLEEMSEKLPNGKPKIENNNYILSDENQLAFDKKIEELKVEYKEVIDAREKQSKEFQELMGEESDFLPFKIKMAQVPEDISVQQMIGITELIDDEGYEAK